MLRFYKALMPVENIFVVANDGTSDEAGQHGIVVERKVDDV
jgi:hypothetical protein